MAKRLLVAILLPGFRQYRRRFLELFEDALNAHGVDLLVGHPSAPLATSQGDERLETAPSRPVLALRRQLAGRELLVTTPPPGWWRADLFILPEGTGYPTGWAVLGARKLFRRRTGLFGHGTDFARPGRDDVAERANRFRMRHLDWWFAYNDASADAVRDRGFPADRLSVVNNTLDTSEMKAITEGWGSVEKAAFRRSLGIGEGPLGLFIGALHADKQLSGLIERADLIRKELPRFELLIVGDGPEAGVVTLAKRTRSWLHHLQGDVSDGRARYWAIADIALYPAWAGLAVNEALSMGVPLALSRAAPHPPEASYLNDANGLPVDDGGHADVYAAAVVDLLRDERRLGSIRTEARRSAGELGVHAMAARFADGCLCALEASPRNARRDRSVRR